MRKVKFVSMFVLLVLLSSLVLMLPSIGAAHPQDVPNKAGPIWAYTLQKAFFAEGQWHYGAFFRGKEGYWQHYRYGDWLTAPWEDGIENWDWWGTFYQVLLTPKRWLAAGSPHSWYGCNYKANFQVVL